MKSPKPQVADFRTPLEKQAADAAAQSAIAKKERFAGYREQEDFGYDTQRLASLNPAYARAQDRMSEDIAQQYARLGFGPKRVGPQAASVARETRRLSEGRASAEATDRGNWRYFVETSGNAPLPSIPQGPGAQIYQPGPDPLMSMFGSLAGAGGGAAAGNLFPQKREVRFGNLA